IRGFSKQTTESLLPFAMGSSEERKKSLGQRFEDLESLSLLERVRRSEKLNLFFENYVVNIPLLYTKQTQLHQEEQQNQQQHQQQEGDPSLYETEEKPRQQRPEENDEN